MPLRLLFAFVVAVAGVFAAPNLYAAEENSPSTGKEARGDGWYSFAKIAVFYDLGNDIIRSIGVKMVTNPQTGVYCIRPEKRINTQKRIGVAAVEWGQSSGNDLLAFWSAGGNSCPNPKRWFEVRTYDQNGSGDWVLSDDIAWTFHVL
ncbi:hypothetical protein [Microbaculum marinisediminis]|uniref:Uncharacterized protein n=1 Tax=Microbaculum marinisediminis TaxID=2931392 RepID=A0AAW5R702_9HYPH|nr:hypothetical protein [Microbaculum sp. A6E488]MCT8974877.1 hypothetical protein [Microbaculum sp. A6E488]